jgi:hypothetical protein
LLWRRYGPGIKAFLKKVFACIGGPLGKLRDLFKLGWSKLKDYWRDFIEWLKGFFSVPEPEPLPKPTQVLPKPQI